METLKKLLDAECGYRMKGETMDRFVGLMSERKVKRNKTLIPYGAVDDNIYIVKTGLVRIAYFDGFKEVTFGFALPGTLLISYYSLCRVDPSFTQLSACCDSVVMKISKAELTRLASESHDFAQWMMFMSLEQLLFHEKKLEVVNGDAKERFIALFKNRPEIIKNVSSKILASYIGITPEYLSKLKRNFAKNL